MIRRSRFAALAVFVLALAPVTAWGFWSVGGTGTGVASVGTLNPPTGVTATAATGGRTVAVSWTAGVEPSGASVGGYYVQRSPGAIDVCGSPASPIPATACVDSGVPDGTYTYTATGVFHSWTATSGASNPAIVDVPTALAFTTSPSTASASGAPFAQQPVVTVEDSAGHAVATDVSTVAVALTTPGGATLTCTNNPSAAAAGVVTFVGCSVDRAGTYTLTATGQSLPPATSASFTIAG